MGCWNATCMVSNLPIRSGEKVKLIFLNENYTKDNNIIGESAFVYSNDLLTPSFLPITGEYDNYGRIDNITKDWNYYLIEDYLKKQLGDTIYVETKFNLKPIKDWELTDIIKGIERGDITYPFTESKDKDLFFTHTMRSSEKKEYAKTDDRDLMLSFVLIRQDVWDYINDNFIGEVTNWTGVGESYISVEQHCENIYNTELENIKKRDLILNNKELSEKDRKYKLIEFSFDNSNHIFYPEYSTELKLLAKSEYLEVFFDDNQREIIYNDWKEIMKIYYSIDDLNDKNIATVDYGIIDGVLNIYIGLWYLDTDWTATETYHVPYEYYEKAKIKLRNKKIKNLFHKSV